jgi:hypothetical protein
VWPKIASIKIFQLSTTQQSRLENYLPFDIAAEKISIAIANFCLQISKINSRPKKFQKIAKEKPLASKSRSTSIN